MTKKQFAIGNDTECPVIEGKFELNREEVVDLLNKQHEYLNILREELKNLKNQIKIYELFLDQNDLHIEWDLFCTLDYCVNEEDTGCQTCKYMGLIDGDSE